MAVMSKRLCRNCGTPFKPKGPANLYHSRACQLAGRSKPLLLQSSTHLVIPDTQCKPGVPNDHLVWINRYIRERYEGQPLTVVHLGDHWDMPSLSSYDRGKGAMEGRRYTADVAAGNRAMELLSEGLEWDGLRLVLLRGNHEERINRAIEADIQLEGLLSQEHLLSPGWEVFDFLVPVNIDGVIFAHYFANPMTGKPIGGENIETRLKNIGHSFTMGHQQTLKFGFRYVNGVQQVGLVCGAAYQHEEEYLGPQGNAHWRGIVVCNNVEKGSYDPMVVNLDYLCRRFEGHRLVEHIGAEL